MEGRRLRKKKRKTRKQRRRVARRRLRRIKKNARRRALRVRVLHVVLDPDHCSFVPDFHVGNCCESHDSDYAKGGTSLQRKESDVRLYECIASTGHPALAWIYYTGVRWFGWLFWPEGRQ